MKSAKTKMSALLVKKDLSALKNKMNPDAIGGTALLGISKPVIKAHGSSNAHAISSAVKQAAKAANSDITIKLQKNIARMKIADSAQ